MTEPSPHSKDKSNSVFRLPILKNSQILALFAIVCTAIVGLVNELTKDQIQLQAQQQLLTTLHSIIAPERYDNDITRDCVNFSYTAVEEQNNSKLATAYIARKSGKAIAIAMTNTAPDGYNGDIELIIAINTDLSVSGVRVLKHKETPGLGDKIELRKSDWITSFTNKSLLAETDSRWAVSKDGGMFDQFTGATITPRAIVNTVKQTLTYFKKNQQTLLTFANACAMNSEQLSASREVNDDK